MTSMFFFAVPQTIVRAFELGFRTEKKWSLARHSTQLSAYTQTLPDAHTTAVARIGAQLFTDCSHLPGGEADRTELTH